MWYHKRETSIFASRHVMNAATIMLRTAMWRLQTNVPLSLWKIAFSTMPADNPLEVIISATESLQSFTTRLLALSDTIQSDITLPSGQVVSMKDIVLHSRDSEPAAFHTPAAQDARTTVIPIAETVEKELKEMSRVYESNIFKQMQKATLICKEIPCGGATWEVDFDSSTRIKVEGKDTPCGRLHNASVAFLEVSFDTKPQVALASRAAALLRIAHKFNAPLVEIQEKGGDEQKKMQETFAAEMVHTPWIRSEEEYRQYYQIKEEMGGSTKRE
jgi:hypothetical protein